MPSTIERAEVGKTRLIPEFPPIPPPLKKITEGDIHTVAEGVIKEAQEQRLSPTANAIVESANSTTLNRLKNLVPDKARRVLRLSVQKAALTLTAGGLYLLISSGCGNTENPNAQSTPEPTSTIRSVDEHLAKLETPIPTNTPTLDTPVDIRKTSEAENKFIKKMKSKYGLTVKTYLMLPGAERAIYGAQTLTEDEIHEIEKSINLMPYCPKNFYDKLIIGKVPEGEPYFSGVAQYPFGYIELNILGSINYMRERFEGRSFSVQEPLGQTLAHECGHMISHRTMHLSATNYPDTPDGRSNFFRDIYEIPENKNPLYVIFSELTNWQFDGAKYKKTSADPRIKDKHYGSIDEFMAEMFAMFKYRPDLLTIEEYTFFKNLENGLSKESDRFLKKVIENPEILLEPISKPP